MPADRSESLAILRDTVEVIREPARATHKPKRWPAGEHQSVHILVQL